jgi:hypothetical protein
LAGENREGGVKVMSENFLYLTKVGIDTYQQADLSDIAWSMLGAQEGDDPSDLFI